MYIKFLKLIKFLMHIVKRNYQRFIFNQFSSKLNFRLNFHKICQSSFSTFFSFRFFIKAKKYLQFSTISFSWKFSIFDWKICVWKHQAKHKSHLCIAKKNVCILLLKKDEIDEIWIDFVLINIFLFYIKENQFSYLNVKVFF